MTLWQLIGLAALVFVIFGFAQMYLNMERETKEILDRMKEEDA